MLRLQSASNLNEGNPLVTPAIEFHALAQLGEFRVEAPDLGPSISPTEIGVYGDGEYATLSVSYDPTANVQHQLPDDAIPGQVSVAYDSLDYLVTYFDIDNVSFEVQDSVVIDAGSSANDGEQDWFTVSSDGTIMQVEVNNTVVYSTPVDSIPHITIQGSGDDDVLLVNFALGNPIPSGLIYDGADQTAADTLIIQGAGDESGVYVPDPETFGNGNITIDSSLITFMGLEPVLVQDMSSFTFVSPGSEDDIVIDSIARGQNRIHGTSDGVPFESLEFSNVDHITIDVQSNEFNGQVTDRIVFSSDLIAEGLDSLTLIASDEDKLDASRVTMLPARHQGERWVFSAPTVPGDLNGDGIVDIIDVDRQCGSLASKESSIDLNDDNTSNYADLLYLIRDILGTDLGDSNLDGRFDSSDLVHIFRRGQYEDEFVANSNWGDGDWDCDGEFGTSDLVAAFRAGSYVTAATASDSTHPAPQLPIAAVALIDIANSDRPSANGTDNGDYGRSPHRARKLSDFTSLDYREKATTDIPTDGAERISGRW